MSDSKSVVISFPYVGIMGVVFVLAKAFEVAPIAGWSWLWVLAPFWIPFTIFTVFIAVALLLALLGALLR